MVLVAYATGYPQGLRCNLKELTSAQDYETYLECLASFKKQGYGNENHGDSLKESLDAMPNKDLDSLFSQFALRQYIQRHLGENIEQAGNRVLNKKDQEEQGELMVDDRNKVIKENDQHKPPLRKRRAALHIVPFNGRTQYVSMLRDYLAWRQVHGYGRHVGRWGRSVNEDTPNDASNDENTIPKRSISRYVVPYSTGNDMTQNIVSTNANTIRMRSKREALAEDFMEILRQYLGWRENFGYGSHGGRWGR